MASSITQHDYVYPYKIAGKKPSFIRRFFAWAEAQDAEHHVAWVGSTVILMAAVFFPATMAAILLNGAVFGLIIAAMAAFALVVVTNLAAMPTKFTIPFFCLGVLIDVLIVAASFLLK